MADPKSGNKPQKLKARLPRGLTDRGPAEIAATRHMVEAIRAVFERYGFEPVETPAIEYTDALGKFLPDQDRPNEGVFSFQDDDEQWLSLRYDLTAPLARYVAERIGTEHLVLPYRSYRFGWVFRNEKPGPGRFRQFMQFDADTVGAPTMAADAEMCMLAADTMEKLGIERGQYVIKVSNRKILDAVLDAIGLVGENNLLRRLTVLRAIDKQDRLGRENVKLLLGPGRTDESGDVTKGAGLNDDEVKLVLSIIDDRWARTQYREGDELPTDDEMIQYGRDFLPQQASLLPEAGNKYFYDNQETLRQVRIQLQDRSANTDGVDELSSMLTLLKAGGYGSRRIQMSTSVVRGLEYYTGPVYEVELTFKINDDKGRPVRFGSVGGGGRYDGLVSRFRGEPVPATGFSIGVSRLQSALTYLKKFDGKQAAGPVVVTVFDKDRVADYQRFVSDLREANIRAELYLGNPKNIGNQLKYADKRHSPCVVIQGGDEKAQGVVMIKDLILGAGLTAIKDRDEYLKKQAEAQFAVKEAELVEAVAALLARHGLT